MKLWQHKTDLDSQIEKYTVGDDYVLDQRLLRWDCLASIAHIAGLRKIEILTDNEFEALKNGLVEIISLDSKGQFKILPEDEDCHTAIETALVKKLGDIGKKVHTARSRNDQVLAALKLFIKHEVINIENNALSFCKCMLDLAKANPIPFPGYTHMQIAMPSSVALWATAFVESMIDNIQVLQSMLAIIDTCPLGSAAGYGVAFELDREYTAKLLGFSKVQNNVIYVQNSRGKNEAQVLTALCNIMLDLNKLSTDLILFSMPEFGYFELPESFCTGSSIMPQKKNPDVLELIRGRAKTVLSLAQQTQGIILDLPSGYNRDFQLTKKPLMEGIDFTCTSLVIMTKLIGGLQVNECKCKSALTPQIFATDIANEYVEKGLPFRDAYIKVKEDLPQINIQDPYHYIKIKNYRGAPGNPGLSELTYQVEQIGQSISKQRNTFQLMVEELSDLKLRAVSI